MKIAWVVDEVITCGGIKIPFGYCRELQKLGIDSNIYANGRNVDLESYYGVTVKPIHELESLIDSDIIIAVWWMQVAELEKYKGHKIQFVQGKDIDAYIGEDMRERVLKTRHNPNWDILAVSKYAGDWTGRPYTVIPNAVDDIFFKKLGIERDIDALIEGNNEPNKNIDFAIQKAKEDGHQKIVWLGLTTKPVEGVEMITNPPQEEIPKIYQRSKHFYKYSNSEGFCLPLVEAIVSGCIVHTHDMGGNDFTEEQAVRFTWDSSVNLLLKFLNNYA